MPFSLLVWLVLLSIAISICPLIYIGAAFSFPTDSFFNHYRGSNII